MTTRGKVSVLYVITKSNLGGAQKYVFDLARDLSGRLEINVALGGDGPLRKRLEELGIPTIPLRSLQRDVNAFNDLKSFFEIRRTIKRTRPDILHLNSSKVGILGALAAHSIWHKPKIVFTAHAWAYNEQRGALSRFAIYMLHAVTIALSSKTIAVSEAIKRQAPCPFLLSSRIETIHLGIRPDELYPRELARETLHLNNDDFIIGTIAELHPIKGLPDLIAAMDHIKDDSPCVILGEGEERPALERQIERSEHRIMLAGYVQNAGKFLLAFDVFVLPSRSEALGYVLLEAGIAGLPVIATNVGGIPEIIIDGQTGILVKPGSPEDIAASLTKLASSPQLRTKLGESLHRHVTENFTIRRMIERTQALYSSLLSDRSPRS